MQEVKLYRKNRDRSIDLLKSILVIGMIIAHVFQFFNGINYNIMKLYSEYINMITFSGFLFCFGYACNLAYMQKEKKAVKNKFIKNSIKMISAFYVSGLAYRIFITGTKINMHSFVKILFLWDIPGYSEFLLAFFIINILTYLLFDYINRLLNSKHLIVVIFITLLTTLIPYELVKINQLGLIIGTTKFPAFPVVQYSIFYLLGMYFQKNKIKFNFKYFIIALLCSVTTIIYYIINGTLPSRFPPSIFWIISPMMYIYIYYLLSIRVTEKYKLSNNIYIFGENTLYFLVSSNLIIFLSKRYMDNNIFTFRENLIFSILVILLCVLLLKILNLLKQFILTNISILFNKNMN